MRIIVDAMGGDNAPTEIVKGCVEAISQADGFEIEVLGDKSQIEKCLGPVNINNPRIIITETWDEITNLDKPTEAVKKKKNSAIVVGMQKIRAQSAQAFISAGSTGALLAGSLLIAGRMKGVSRPALAPVVPSIKGQTMIIDAGMNTQIKAINYLQFAIMGTEYMKGMHGVEEPRVGLVNVGTEEGKGGTETLKQAYEILQDSRINFVGNVEGRDITEGKVDIAVCDGFTGNAMLKIMEGTGKYFMDYLKKMYAKSLSGKISYLLIKHELKKLRKEIDPEELGGTPILGVNGLIYKCHGNSTSKAIKNTILKSCSSACTKVLQEIKDIFANSGSGGNYDTAL